MNLQKYGINDKFSVIEKFLKQNGIESDSDLNSILNPSFEMLHDIFEAKGVFNWLSELYNAQNDNIVVFGDYDADGVMSSSVAYIGLKMLEIGSSVNQYVPLREDGYGISPVAVDKLLAQFPNTNTIITVDNGVAAFEGVEYARQKGLKVLVSDHHLGKESDVNAFVVDINRTDDSYPFKGISGTAVIWKLLYGYSARARPDKMSEIISLLDLVGVSAVTDVMPALDENRYFIKFALNSINNESRLVWKAVKDVLRDNKKLYGDTLNEEFIGFTLGPMLNSPMRVLGSPEIAYKLMTALSYDEAYTYASQLFILNEQRKSEIAQISQQVLEKYDNIKDVNSVVVALPIKAGFAGLVADKLHRKYNRPALVMGGTNGIVHGSTRSPQWFNIVEALGVMASEGLIESYGGHAAAAGFSMDVSNVNKVQSRLSQLVVDALQNVTFTKVSADISLKASHDIFTNNDKTFLNVDGTYISVSNVDLVNIVSDFEKLRPFGNDFKAPVTELDDITMQEIRHMGSNKQHVKVDSNGIGVIAWNVGNTWDDYSNGLSVNGTLGINEFRGKSTPQIIVSDVLSD